MLKIFTALLTVACFSTAYSQNCAFQFQTKYTNNVVSALPGEVSINEVQINTGANRVLKYTALTTKDGKQFSESEMFTDGLSDLIIAVDVNGNTKGHMYLVIDNTRIDGRMFFAPHTEEKTNWYLSRGLIIRYKNLPPEAKLKLKEWLDSNQQIKTATCVAAACRILYDFGGFQNGPRKPYWFPSRFLSHLARSGLVDQNGERIVPEIYTINSAIELFWNNLPSWRTVPNFIFKVLFDPYTWKGAKDVKEEKK